MNRIGFFEKLIARVIYFMLKYGIAAVIIFSIILCFITRDKEIIELTIKLIALEAGCFGAFIGIILLEVYVISPLQEKERKREEEEREERKIIYEKVRKGEYPYNIRK